MGQLVAVVAVVAATDLLRTCRRLAIHVWK